MKTSPTLACVNGAPLNKGAPSPTAISVNALHIRFGALTVIENMDFTIRSQEFVSLLGPSGCGKSTLLRAIAGLIAPTSGSVRLGDVDAVESKQDNAGLRVGLMFQKPLLLPWRTTLENVLLPVEIERGGSRVDDIDIVRAKRVLSLVRLTDFEQSYPHQLSGGMQQRAALARALMSDPDLLLLDEPFGALDELTRDALNEELLAIWRSTETRLKTIVMVTHSIPEAVALSDRIFVFAPRPARLAKVVDIELPHPRDQENMAFMQSVSQVRQLVRSLS
ncbi:ABC transporter ATP-binding protein [Herbaspirillum sp. CAH-3]|uniref:ABC transporter ATP-binding protein n=1 Tax=Herbaspirillum sp. CAH-3 TaxID=2605746 RepID=UPI0012ACEA10|nr:ABC transporter ATP-binding protein [Herbaspirillum sp. CAH-3]MRT30936.1 ABC transporter ATP-binding protein [Herbaspirillum sp. CAH-3]